MTDQRPIPAPVPFLDLAPAVAEQREELDATWARLLNGGQLILGPELAAFEAEFAPAAGSAHAVGVGNGLDALAFALEAAGIGPGDDVVVPAHTFIATWIAVRMTGARPIPAEPAPGRYNVDAEGIEAALTPRTRAVVVVHLYGDPVPIEPILDLAARRGLMIFEDAAQAHGARRNGTLAGGWGLASGFSFYPTKNLGGLGDGGAVTTSDAALVDRVRRLRNYGSERKYEHDEFGRNSRLDPLQASVLRIRLKRLAAWNTRRREVAARYLDGLQGIDGLGLPFIDAANEPVWHLFVVRTSHREALAGDLGAQGIGTLIHYPRAVYRFPPFAEGAPAHGTPADRLASEVLSLPMGPHQTDEQTDGVIAAIRRHFGA